MKGNKKLEQSYLAAFGFERRLQPVAEGPQVKTDYILRMGALKKA